MKYLPAFASLAIMAWIIKEIIRHNSYCLLDTCFIILSR